MGQVIREWLYYPMTTYNLTQVGNHTKGQIASKTIVQEYSTCFHLDTKARIRQLHQLIDKTRHDGDLFTFKVQPMLKLLKVYNSIV